MKTIKEWKERLQVGIVFKQIWNSQEGVVEHWCTITGIAQHGVWVQRENTRKRSWLAFPKRGEIAFTEHGWSRVEGTRRIAEYVWITEEKAQ